MRRKQKTLTYEIPPYTGSPINASLVRFSEALGRLSGHHSTGEWKRACDASLRASRRRRGLA